ncbi:hypothetical protein PLICBS_002179 [Purpureocillium lilacinum]|uniref:uncharacterized protein n=1 Tax=Purpureocillium lilacinum TaxID=33203 RepID=UPI00208612F2|nr:hypothetical protein PLICBS_002179 [Purpureocillium lilacinum]
MSWSREDDYAAFKAAASSYNSPNPRPWSLLVWDVAHANPEGNWHVEPSSDCLRSEATLRIVFAPLHGGQREWISDFVELFRVLNVPSDFTTERTQSVCHSFASRTDRHGTCSWFHFLFKNITIRHEPGKMPEVDLRIPGRWQQGGASLPQADYSWLIASFFMRVHTHGGVTLVCFGAPPRVRRRFEEFVDSCGWDDVQTNPYVLFDVLLEGLYFEVDKMVWNMNTIFGPLEHSILELAHTKDYGQLNSRLSFAALHNCAKHIIYLGEGLDAALLLLDSALAHARDFGRSENTRGLAANAGRPRAELVTRLVRERLSYRKSLFRSTQLRLSSLHKRIDNSIALAFNVVTQKDSMVVTRDSSVMKMIAAITMVFLPTTGVATVVGSQLLVSEWQKESQSWNVMATPLFWTTWWITIPLTVCVLAVAFVWQWWPHSERAQDQTRKILRKPANLFARGKTASTG